MKQAQVQKTNPTPPKKKQKTKPTKKNLVSFY